MLYNIINHQQGKSHKEVIVERMMIQDKSYKSIDSQQIISYQHDTPVIIRKLKTSYFTLTLTQSIA